MHQTVDPDGRRVVLRATTWEHILERHPELHGHLQSVLAAVEAPTRRMPGRAGDEEWFYRSGAGPSRWVKVVVHYEGDEGRIVTSFARRAFP